MYAGSLWSSLEQYDGLVVQSRAPAASARSVSWAVGLLIQSRVGVSAWTLWKYPDAAI
jgi:hypothetical protein